ncbi:MAG: O-antigen ligase family protein, partial [Candidatus Hydrogenedentota bacterium]
MAELITALVLGGLALLRPWHDGMALPAINDYYIWAQVVLFALVSARLLVRGEPLRSPLLITLFAAFIGVAVLSTLDTAQYNNSYRALIVWWGHFFLFVVAAQTLRQPRSFAIVLSGFVAGALAEAVFSVMHLKYYIPLVRDRVKMDPSLVQRYFSAPELNPEIARRLNTNRAFGTFLFPNALAGYMVLCVPFALGAGAYSIRTLRALLQRTAERPPKRNPTEAAATGFVSWAITLVIAYTAHSFFFAVAYRDAPMSAHWIQWILSVGLFPLTVGTILYFVTKKHGVLAALWTVAACVLPVFAMATFLALFYSYSRGGMLAFVAATLFTGGLLFVLLRKPRLLPARWTGVALLLLACVVLISTMDTQAATRPSSELITEGVDMTIGELANPATMLLRVTYWRTALYMIADNFWTGVGPGNFGVMYPRYKYVTAGETKHAHNDYLQVFAETGILGALVFYAFWAVFVVAGLRRLVQMRSSPRLWLLAGLFAGVFAFLLHAVVDFDFFNPSLATAAFLLSGLFCAATTNPPPQEPTHGYARPIAVVFLVLSAIALTASVRVHRADALAGSEPEFRTKLLASQFFVFDAPERYADDRQGANIP